MRLKAIVAALCLSTSAAIAGDCSPPDARDIPLFERLKSAFLAADYREFARMLGPYFGDADTVYNTYFPTLERVLPEGFEWCRTILQRREAPGFHQELVLFYPSGRTTPMALLLIGAEVGDGIVPIEFVYDTNISDVLSELK